jgi:hypothetical protein
VRASIGSGSRRDETLLLRIERARKKLTFDRPQRDHFFSMDDYGVVAQELNVLGEKIRDFDDRLAEVERVNARLEEAALTTARAMAEISHHWDAVYEAMRRAETTDTSTMSERDNAAARARRSSPSDSSEPPRTDD